MKSYYKKQLTPEQIATIESIKHERIASNWIHSNHNGWKHYKFTFIINGQSFDYSVGLGHAIKPPKGVMAYPVDSAVAKQIAIAKSEGESLVRIGYDVVKAPQILDLLLCVRSDSMLANDTHEEFCLNCGYDTDSRRGLELYLECQKQDSRLRSALGKKYSEVMAILETLEA